MEVVSDKQETPYPAATAPENISSGFHAVLDSHCQVFSPGDFTEPQPPGADTSDPNTDLLIQMFMSELGTGEPNLDLTSSDLHSSLPSSFTASPPPKPAPSPTPAPSSPLSLSPSPSSSTFSPSQVLACPSTAAPDTAHSPDLDDPFLVNFADLDGLLKDSALFDIPSPSDVDFMSSFPDPSAQDPLLVFPDCSPVSPPTLSPSNDSVNATDQTLDSPTDHPSPLLSELFVRHDHSYTTEQSITDSSTTVHLHKRKASETESLATSPGPAKKQRQTVKDEKYHIRRQKNNVASQISRAKRRAKHVDMFTRVKELEETNARLKAQISEMEAEAAHLRKSLVTKLAA